MFTAHRSRAAAIRSKSRSRVEVTGTTLGMSSTAVTPPWMAAREPVAKSSLWVIPGSRKWTWASIRPGSTYCPAAS